MSAFPGATPLYVPSPPVANQVNTGVSGLANRPNGPNVLQSSAPQASNQGSNLNNVINPTTTSAGAAAALALTPNANANANPTALGNGLGHVSSVARRFQRQWVDFWNASNGIGVTALIMGLVFGVGAWVGMNMSYHQGAKGLELSIWTTCADHVVGCIIEIAKPPLVRLIGLSRTFRIQLFVDPCCQRASINSRNAAFLMRLKKRKW